MKTETIQVTAKVQGETKVVAEVEIERFEGSDSLDKIFNVIDDFLGGWSKRHDWLNKVYEAEVVRRARKSAIAPKVPPKLLKKFKERIIKDPAYRAEKCEELGVEL